MAAGGLLWTFTQLAPGANNQTKTLTLGGWSAPFGRPRNGAIFNAGLEIRNERTDYPGRNLAPTIHKFGSKGKPIEIHGRWMDRTIPQITGAQQYVQQWKNFVNDQVAVRMSWGNIISYQIFIYDIDLHFEGPADVVWMIKAHLLVDDQQAIPPKLNPISAPFDIANQMNNLMANLTGGASAAFTPVSTLLGMLNNLQDQLTILKGQINAPFASIYNTCSAISSFQLAVSSDLTSMLSGVTAMQTGLLDLRDTTDYVLSSAAELNTPNAAALNGVNGVLLTGSDVVSLVSFKMQNDANISSMLALLAYLQSQIDLTRRGTAQTAYTAQTGDTWESIAEKILGTADGARNIKSFNGIRYGQQPNPGQSYTIPKNS